VLEESPSPIIDEKLRARIREASITGAASLQYRGAGTMEFLFDESSKSFFFLEMNTRLQVEHPVTEMVTGIDLVGMQLDIAAGRKLEHNPDVPIRGWSIEFRICAEDPYNNFAPSTGQIRALRIPHAPFCRIDGSIREGLEISPYYDPMLDKAIVWGETRSQAIDRMSALLSRLRIGGIHTTVPLGIEITKQDWFKAGQFDIGTLETWLQSRSEQILEPDTLQLVSAVIARHALGAARKQSTPASPGGGAWGKAARADGTKSPLI
jgi:acetyl-CoA carboxylase biotin carboxylase subunit